MIYFIADCEYVKVGYAKNIGKRVTTLQCANPRPFTLIASCEGDESLELELHRHLPGRVNRDREWFRITPTLMKLVADISLRGTAAVHEHIDAVKAKKSAPPIDWDAHDKQFHADVADVFTRLVSDHGSRKIADILDCSTQSIGLYRKGSSVPLGTKFVRLFNAFPELLERFPAFKPLQATIANIANIQAERITA